MKSCRKHIKQQLLMQVYSKPLLSPTSRNLRRSLLADAPLAAPQSDITYS